MCTGCWDERPTSRPEVDPIVSTKIWRLFATLSSLAGGAGPVGGLLGGKDPTGRSSRLDQDPEHVVVARRGVVGEDQRAEGEREPPRRDVHAAAHARPGGAPGRRRAALGPVE